MWDEERNNFWQGRRKQTVSLQFNHIVLSSSIIKINSAKYKLTVVKSQRQWCAFSPVNCLSVSTTWSVIESQQSLLSWQKDNESTASSWTALSVHDCILNFEKRSTSFPVSLAISHVAFNHLPLTIHLPYFKLSSLVAFSLPTSSSLAIPLLVSSHTPHRRHL